MKVKTISRLESDYVATRSGDLNRMPRNADPALHPFERAREYTRALNATKLDKVFAKPFVRSLSGHSDGIYTMARSRTAVCDFVSGAGDGEIRYWDLSTGICKWAIPAHQGMVKGTGFAAGGDVIVSAGSDSTIKLWEAESSCNFAMGEVPEPLHTYVSKSPVLDMDCHWSEPMFATGGTSIDVWHHERSKPLQTMQWGLDTNGSIKFHPIEKHLLASTCDDRAIVLHDTRAGTPVRKVVLNMRSNCLSWNPMEAMNIVAANEDHNLYTFDIRKMDSAMNVHKDFVAAVMAVDFAPTGREFVAGSYDRTIRIFKYNAGHSREVYFNRRMQRIFSVQFSGDAKWVLSGSDEGNVRLWKANASDSVGTMLPREKRSKEYRDKLKERYAHMPEIRRIARHRSLPRAITKATRIKREIKDASKKREDNRRRHSKPGSVPFEKERKKKIVTTME